MVPMVAPSKFAHVVYNTHRYDEMIEWYQFVFEARVGHRGSELAFLTYDEEHHRFAFRDLGPMPDPPVEPRMGKGPGVAHVAYTYRDLAELVDQYSRLKERGIVPQRPIRHGMTLSMYYADPDGNVMEFQIDLCSPEEAYEFMESDVFAANPIGERFDPDELVRRFAAGEPVNDLIFRSDQPESAVPA